MRRLLLGIGIVLTVIACGGERAEDEAADAAPGESPAAGEGAALGNSTISGTVNFTGTPPANPPIDMSEEEECAKAYTETPTDPQVVVTDGKLANVFVYVKSGLPEGQDFPTPSQPAVIDQEGCLYKPRAFGAMVGQDIQILNSDPVLHNIKAVPKVNRGFNISQPKEGMKTTRKFSKPEVMVPIECNVHGWMHASIGVVEHPFFATSGEDGSFTIKGLPAGKYELEAVHEKLGTKTLSVTVPEGGEAKAELTFGAAAS